MQSSKAALRSQFCGITNVLPQQATAYLEKHRWNIQQALRVYYNEPENTASPAEPPNSALLAIYDKYKDPAAPEAILIDGTLAYLDDLHFDPEDAISLTLAYVLKSPQTGEFPKAAFLEVWGLLRISSVDEMRKYIVDRHNSIQQSQQEFEQFYRYVYDFVRGSDTRIKSIGHEEAVLYWRLLFSASGDFASAQPRLEQWYTFIGENERNITKDAWNMFYKFVVEVIVADPEKLAGYDEMSAWPSVVDEYVEWLEENNLLHQE